MIRVAVVGAAGRMGTSILNTLAGEKGIEIVGATEVRGHPLAGSKLSGIIKGVKSNITITEDQDSAYKTADVIVDFTTPASTLLTARYCAKQNKAIVIGTTGFSGPQMKKLNSYLKKIPAVVSPNMSIGVNLVFELAKTMSAQLGNDYDVEIVEAHHSNKVDAPSGTALRLAESVAEGLGVNLKKHAKYERHGEIGKRKKGEIGIQTIRGGDVVGDHTVMFLGEGERIELTHRANSRDNFSKGVLRAVKWVVGKPPGTYSMKDVLGL